MTARIPEGLIGLCGRGREEAHRVTLCRHGPEVETSGGKDEQPDPGCPSSFSRLSNTFAVRCRRAPRAPAVPGPLDVTTLVKTIAPGASPGTVARIPMRTEVQGFAIVHQRRRRTGGRFDGAFLAERQGEWLAGRQFTTQSEHDGFTDNGAWQYADRYASPLQHEAYRAHRALQEYVRVAKAADCWEASFEHEAGEAIDRYWAQRVPLTSVADMALSWSCPGPTGEVVGGTALLPARKAKYELLNHMRHSRAVSEAFSAHAERHVRSKLREVYQAALQADGPVRLAMGDERFALSYGGA